MKIATFNINNINKRLNNLTAWFKRAEPDVVCLQELKVEQRAFPASALRDLGYGGVWIGERSWNGVAILTRDCDPMLTRSTLPGNPADSQARYVEAAVNGVLIASIYLPNGNPQPGPKFNYKLAWPRAITLMCCCRSCPRWSRSWRLVVWPCHARLIGLAPAKAPKSSGEFAG